MLGNILRKEVYACINPVYNTATTQKTVLECFLYKNRIRLNISYLLYEKWQYKYNAMKYTHMELFIHFSVPVDPYDILFL